MPLPRLSDSTVAHAAAQRPAYDRAAPPVGVVHLGLGAFPRAHLAVFLDDLLALHPEGPWAMLGVSMRSTDIVHALNPQDGLYTVGTIDGDTIGARVVGSVRHVLHEPTSPALVRHALSAATTTMITATVTEKGYCTDPATKRLDLDHPDIRHDIEHLERPRSLPGQLVATFAERRARRTGPVTVLSLDNMPANGHTLQRAVADLAAATDPTLNAWIDNEVRFPCSMVDRMVPATDEPFRERIAAVTGLHDAWPVRAEPFRQWVVERGWATPMPPLADVGVTVVDDVGPWEHTKLRVLNALHTAAALFGLRHGLETVDQVARDERGARLLDRLAGEIVEVLTPPDGVDLGGYVATTLGRFRNPGLHHRCAQIATDTSQKLPQRLLGTVHERLARGLPIDAATDVLALWAWSTLGRDHEGGERPVADPLADTFASIAARHAADHHGLATALLCLREIFGDLAGDPRVTAPVADRLAALL